MHKNSNEKPWNHLEAKTRKLCSIPGVAASVAGVEVLSESVDHGGSTAPDLPNDDFDSLMPQRTQSPSGLHHCQTKYYGRS